MDAPGFTHPAPSRDSIGTRGDWSAGDAVSLSARHSAPGYHSDQTGWTPGGQRGRVVSPGVGRPGPPVSLWRRSPHASARCSDLSSVRPGLPGEALRDVCRESTGRLERQEPPRLEVPPAPRGVTLGGPAVAGAVPEIPTLASILREPRPRRSSRLDGSGQSGRGPYRRAGTAWSSRSGSWKPASPVPTVPLVEDSRSRRGSRQSDSANDKQASRAVTAAERSRGPHQAHPRARSGAQGGRGLAITAGRAARVSAVSANCASTESGDWVMAW